MEAPGVSGPIELADGSVVVPASLAGSVRRILVRDLAQHIRSDGGAPSVGARQLLYALARAEARHELGRGHSNDGSDSGTTDQAGHTLELSTQQVAEAIGCSASFVRRLCRSGLLNGRRAGRRTWLVDAASLDAYRYRR
jgi:excisionase family DNA binding protein